MALNNTYDRSRDPRLSHRHSNIEMTDIVSVAPTSRGETVSMAPLSIAMASATNDFMPTRRISDLIVRIANQEADNARLQLEKTAAKESARDLHQRLNQTTQSLATLTASYTKRLVEKNTLLDGNVNIEQRHTKMRAETADYAREISVMTTKVQVMEAQMQAYEIENAELRTHLTTLEIESRTLQRRVINLELEQSRRRNPENVGQDIWSDRNDSTQDPRSSLNAPASYHDTHIDRNVKYGEAIYTEGRRKSSGFHEGDTYRPDPRRERDGRREARQKRFDNDFFNADQRTTTGRRAERR